MRYGYDPGCSRRPAGGSDEDGVLEVASALGLTLEEIETPGGCGREILAMNAIPAYARVGRLLALAARQLAAREDASVPPSVVTPCSACFLNLSRARHSLATHADLRDRVAEELAAMGLSLDPGSVRVRHLLDVLYEDAGPDEIRRRVTRPLAHLRVAPYYGCLTTRRRFPDPVGEDPAHPTRLEEILSALGAEAVDFPLKAHCCGGRASEASEEVATSLHHRILRSAADHGANAIATVCPRCLRNLEAGQEAVNRRFRTRFAIPVRYFTDLVAEALEVPLGVRS
ncbi:MAG TPA: CoB--CoM heterodisulfide reductase iron-sulfur subunit B family protein [Thermoanaerobaculia bacterium]|nr:CoB--CoM heterodisulfide reductase iron-sulfur subunit B family protein [Thermoanaerobaculia bacterium]